MKQWFIFIRVILFTFGVYAEDSIGEVVQANLPPPPNWEFKFTASNYSTTHSPNAMDFNLRANYGQHAIWLGRYQRGAEFQQNRSGYEYTVSIPYGQLVTSLQLASHDFIGEAINAELGSQYYVLLGWTYQ
jgi:hypothetical protein